MNPHNNVDAFLYTFESVADQWPKGHWAGILATFLAKHAQHAYFHLAPGEAAFYENLKTEILRYLRVTTLIQAQAE